MKKMVLQVLVILLLVGVMSLPAWTPVGAEEMACPEHTPVSIDIKPGSYQKSIRLSSKGLVPIAVLTTPDFDARQFMPEMAHLMDANTDVSGGCPGPMAFRWVRDDVNEDGQPDLVFLFKTQDLNLTPNSTAATLMAHGLYGLTTLHIMGTDTVKVKP